MTNVTVYKDKDNRYRGFLCEGHAGYADIGEDIVCSAISVCVTGACNAIENLTENAFTQRADEESGSIYMEFPKGLDHDGTLLMDSMVMTLRGIEESYSDFLQISIEEV